MFHEEAAKAALSLGIRGERLTQTLQPNGLWIISRIAKWKRPKQKFRDVRLMSEAQRRITWSSNSR